VCTAPDRLGCATVSRITSATAPTATTTVHTPHRSGVIYRGSPRPGTRTRSTSAVPPPIAAHYSRPDAGGARGAFPRGWPGGNSAGLRVPVGAACAQLALGQDGSAAARVARERAGAIRRPATARANALEKPASRPRPRQGPGPRPGPRVRSPAAATTRRTSAPVVRASSASAAAAAATTTPADKKLPRADAHPAGRAPAPLHHSPRPSGRHRSSSSPPQHLLQQQAAQQRPQTPPISARSPGPLHRDRDHARLPPTPPPLPRATAQRSAVRDERGR